MVYELRIYYMHPGKMKNILDRFENVTMALFERHGIKVTDFWVSAQGDEILYYVCEFESAEEKAQKWSTFKDDPEWAAAKAKSEESGPIVSKVESILMENAPFFKK